MKIASLTLAYNQETYIEYSLSAIAGYVDFVIVLYSSEPFTEYNPNSRTLNFKIDGTKGILNNLSNENPHLLIFEGTWSNENDMRNHGISVANDLGCDFLLIIDADEFYHVSHLTHLIKYISKHPHHDSYWSRFQIPFKNPDFIIDKEDEYLPIAIRLSEHIKFVNRRIPNGKRMRVPSHILCYNLGFIMSDERMLEKILTYSHAHQIPKNWYKEKWLNWSPQTVNLHTRIPNLWPRTKKIGTSSLPSALHSHKLIALD